MGHFRPPPPPSSFTFPIAYLGSQPLQQPCSVRHIPGGGKTIRCRAALNRLEPSGVYVAVTANGRPVFDEGSLPGRETTVAGIPAKVHEYRTGCGIGAERAVDLTIPLIRQPGNSYEIHACIAGPNVPRGEAQVRELVHSIQLERTATPRFGSPKGALRFIRRWVGFPVALPPDLPEGTRAKLRLGDEVSSRHVQLDLITPSGRVLIAQYGHAGFDGCGPLNPQEVRIGAATGLLETQKQDGPPFAAVIWPATRDHTVGRYGLSGPFPSTQILAFARSMEVANGTAERKQNC